MQWSCSSTRCIDDLLLSTWLGFEPICLRCTPTTSTPASPKPECPDSSPSPSTWPAIFFPLAILWIASSRGNGWTWKLTFLNSCEESYGFEPILSLGAQYCPYSIDCTENPIFSGSRSPSRFTCCWPYHIYHLYQPYQSYHLYKSYQHYQLSFPYFFGSSFRCLALR